MSDKIKMVEYVVFGTDEDGKFVMDMSPDDEKTARFLASKGRDVLNAYYIQKQANKALFESEQSRIVRPRNGRVN